MIYSNVEFGSKKRTGDFRGVFNGTERDSGHLPYLTCGTTPPCDWCTQCHLVAGVHAGELWLVYNAILWLVYTMPCCGWCTLSRVAGDKECEWPVTEDTPSKKGLGFRV